MQIQDKDHLADGGTTAVHGDEGRTAWLPIESAPKDGTEILAWRDDCGPFIASWTAPENFLGGDQIENELGDMEGEDREALGNAMAAYSWFGGDSTLGGFRCESSEVPTHWQPLPPGPTA